VVETSCWFESGQGHQTVLLNLPCGLDRCDPTYRKVSAGVHAVHPFEAASAVGNIDQGSHSMRYTVVLEREEDGGYVASVPALPGCVSQGDTRAEAMNNIREAIELYVQDCRDAGDPVPNEAGKAFVEIEAA